jgi:hypothetical protein
MTIDPQATPGETHVSVIETPRGEVVVVAPEAPPRAKLEDTVENLLFGVLAYTGRAFATTRDAIFRPLAFVRSLPSPRYCRPTTYFVIALFLETLLATTLLTLERARPDNMIDKQSAAEVAQSVGSAAQAGNWVSLLATLAPMIAIVVLFSAFLSAFARRRTGADFHRCFEAACYSVGAPTLLRVALMLGLLPMMAANAGATSSSGFETGKNIVLGLVAVLQAYPVVLLCLHLRQWTGRLSTALWLWLKAAACTLLVVAAVAAWSYPLWKDVIHLPV